MELEKGYQNTEVGVIPEDWEVKPLKEVANFLDGERRPIKSSDRAKMRGDYPYYGASGIIDYVNDFIFDDNLILLGEDGENILSRSTRLAFTIEGKTWVNNHAHVLKPKEHVDITYLTEYLESLDYEHYNTGTAQPKINQKVCSIIPIVVPPYEEQTAIAAVLSDTDSLIQSLDALIAKKRLIKQGTMQQLLTPPDKGGKRLKGFRGEWGECNLGRSATLKARIGWQGLTTSEYKTQGDYFLITGTDFKNGFIDWENCFYVEQERYKQDRNIQIRKGDVLVTKDGTIGKVAYINKVPKPATLNSGVFVIRPINEAFDSGFFYYILMSRHFKEFLSQLTAGSTISHLYQKDFVHFKFPIPPTKEEQTTIAQILSDMDREIEALERKRSKYERIKEGMMGVLLTGQVRLT